MEKRDRPIGVFDSGLGGLTVLSALHRELPSEDLLYFGDTARVPYGSKSRETVIQYSLEIVDFLLERDVKMIVAACNTVSSYALEAMRERSPVPVLGVVEPGVNALVGAIREEPAESRRAALIATRSTVKSGYYEDVLKSLAPEVNLYSKACPLLVPLIEEGFIGKHLADLAIREYLDEIHREGIGYVILGCTHYPLLKEAIKRLYPEFILIDSSVAIAQSVKESLESLPDGSGKKTQKGTIHLFVSDITDSLSDMENLFFGNPIAGVEKVVLGW